MTKSLYFSKTTTTTITLHGDSSEFWWQNEHGVVISTMFRLPLDAYIWANTNGYSSIKSQK